MAVLSSARVLVGVCLAAAPVSAQPLLRAADVRVVVRSPTSCEVRAAFTVEPGGRTTIEHRLHAPPGLQLEAFAVGTREVTPGDVRRTGLTLAYDVAVDVPVSYTLQYRVSLPEDWAYRCPIWLPAVPTDGLSRGVRMEVELPSGGVPRGVSLPAFSWTANRGVAAIGHVPAFVRVPHATAGYAPRGAAAWDLPRAMDLVAIGTVAGATGFWLWRRRSRGPEAGRG